MPSPKTGPDSTPNSKLKPASSRENGTEVIKARYASLATLLVPPDNIRCLALTALEQGLVVGVYGVQKITNARANEIVSARLAAICRCMQHMDRLNKAGLDSPKDEEVIADLLVKINTEVDFLDVSYTGGGGKEAHKKRTQEALVKLFYDVYRLEPDINSDADINDSALQRLSKILHKDTTPILFTNSFNSGLHSEQEVKLGVVEFFSAYPSLLQDDTEFVIGVNIPACKRCKDSYTGIYTINGKNITFSTLSDTGQHGASGKSHVSFDEAQKHLHEKQSKDAEFKKQCIDKFRDFKNAKSVSSSCLRVPLKLRAQETIPGSPTAAATRKRSKSRARLLVISAPIVDSSPKSIINPKDTETKDLSKSPKPFKATKPSKSD